MNEVIRNPAISRPLSRNVRRLMKMERQSPKNPNVIKAERHFSEQDIAYCELQGEIFMGAIDRGAEISDFAPVFMNSQIAGILDYSFSCAKGVKDDEITNLLKMPLLLESPDIIADMTIWLHDIVGRKKEHQTIMEAFSELAADTHLPDVKPPDKSINELAEEYEYAYWLGYIYRYESLLHEESSRMVYGVFSEDHMRKMYNQMIKGNDDISLENSAKEICRRLDQLLADAPETTEWRN